MEMTLKDTWDETTMQDIGVVFLTKRTTSVKGDGWKEIDSLEDMKEGK